MVEVGACALMPANAWAGRASAAAVLPARWWCICRRLMALHTCCASVSHGPHRNVLCDCCTASPPDAEALHPGRAGAPAGPHLHLLPAQVCDLASLASIKALAEDYLGTGQPLDVLVNK